MRRRLLLIAALMMLTRAAVFCQDDSTRYIFGLPVSDDDTAQQPLQRDLAPRQNFRAVPLNQLPPDVLHALDDGPQYQGWRDSTVYFDKNTRLFIVPVKNKDGINIYGLNENGRPVTFDAVRDSEDK